MAFDPSKIKMAGQIRRYVKIGIYGESGTGKTRFGLDGGTFQFSPTGEVQHAGELWPNPVFVNAESGVDAYEYLFPGQFAKIDLKSPKDVKDLTDWVRNDDRGKTVGTLIIDTWTVLRDTLREAIFIAKEGKGKEVGAREMALVNREMSFLSNHLLGLPVHTIVVAREADLYAPNTGANLQKIGVKADTDKGWNYAYDFILHFQERRNQDSTRAIVKKARGWRLGDNQFVLNNPSWSKDFKLIAEKWSEGQYEEVSSDEDAMRQEMVRISSEQMMPELPERCFRNKEFAQGWQLKWENMDSRLTVPTMRKILGVKLFSELDNRGSVEDADTLIKDWLNVNSVAEPVA